jgi:hypothetical protein
MERLKEAESGRETERQTERETEIHGQRTRMLSHRLDMLTRHCSAGYTPNDYPSPLEWQGRRMIEESLAVKCPTVTQQLSGLKKVRGAMTGRWFKLIRLVQIQQCLSAPGVLETYCAGGKNRTCCITS